MSKLLPNTTQTPNYFLDEIMHMLTGEELKVLMYTVRRTLGFQRRRDRISLSQYATGLVSQEGHRLDYGTGLSVPTVRKALNNLIDFGLIVQSKKNDPYKNEGPQYELQIDDRKLQIARLEARYAETTERNVQRTAKARTTLATGQTPYSATEGVLSDNTAPLLSDNSPALLSDYNTKERSETKEERKREAQPQAAAATPPAAAGIDQATGKRERDPNLDHPAYLLYRQLVTDYTPPAVVRAKIAKTVTDLDLWAQAIEEWLSAGNKKMNVAGMLDWYKHPDRMPSKKQEQQYEKPGQYHSRDRAVGGNTSSGAGAAGRVVVSGTSRSANGEIPPWL